MLSLPAENTGKVNAVVFIFSRLCSPRGAGLIPSWMTPTCWFTVTFPVLFTEKGMAISFPRWVPVDLTLWMLWSLKLIFALLCSWKYQGMSQSRILEYWLECCIHTWMHLYNSSNYLTCVNSAFFYYWTKLWLWKCSLMCSSILILCEKPLWVKSINCRYMVALAYDNSDRQLITQKSPAPSLVHWVGR